MRVLCSFPGRHGDLLWALPTVRAIAESTGGPVDLLIAGEFAGLVPLLELQPYLARVVADPAWGIGAGWEPPNRADLISPYEFTYHLGYRRWPERPLPFEIFETIASGWVPPIDLTRPWITVEPFADAAHSPYPIVAGWSECWFELKYGLCQLLEARAHGDVFPIICPEGSRWSTETRLAPQRSLRIYETDWMGAARFIRSARVFLGDCSALHVLAVALGIPVVLVEPMEARWNPIFYPCGKAGGQVTLVIGGDGQPTFDARHTCDTIEARLAHLPAKGR